MYTPHHFKVDENIVREFIRELGFGALVTHADGQLWATHIPLVLSEDGTKLSGHISRANKGWQAFESAGEVMTIFQGPHAYVSASWYDHQNVSTWNYIAAHVYGTIRIVEGEEFYQSLKTLLDKYEKRSEHPVRMENLSGDYVEKNMRGIVGFEISISRIDASFKLSQNRDAKNYQAVIAALENRGDSESLNVAALMKDNESNVFPNQ